MWVARLLSHDNSQTKHLSGSKPPAKPPPPASWTNPQERILERLGQLSQAHDLEGDAVSKALAQAYSAVTREHLLQ